MTLTPTVQRVLDELKRDKLHQSQDIAEKCECSASFVRRVRAHLRSKRSFTKTEGVSDSDHEVFLSVPSGQKHSETPRNTQKHLESDRKTATQRFSETPRNTQKHPVPETLRNTQKHSVPETPRNTQKHSETPPHSHPVNLINNTDRNSLTGSNGSRPKNKKRRHTQARASKKPSPAFIIVGFMVAGAVTAFASVGMTGSSLKEAVDDVAFACGVAMALSLAIAGISLVLGWQRRINADDPDPNDDSDGYVTRSTAKLYVVLAVLVLANMFTIYFKLDAAAENTRAPETQAQAMRDGLKLIQAPAAQANPWEIRAGESVRDFQKRIGVKDDGTIGSKTRARMDELRAQHSAELNQANAGFVAAQTAVIEKAAKKQAEVKHTALSVAGPFYPVFLVCILNVLEAICASMVAWFAHSRIRQSLAWLSGYMVVIIAATVLAALSLNGVDVIGKIGGWFAR